MLSLFRCYRNFTSRVHRLLRENLCPFHDTTLKQLLKLPFLTLPKLTVSHLLKRLAVPKLLFVRYRPISFYRFGRRSFLPPDRLRDSTLMNPELDSHSLGLSSSTHMKILILIFLNYITCR